MPHVGAAGLVGVELFGSEIEEDTEVHFAANKRPKRAERADQPLQGPNHTDALEGRPSACH